MTPLFEREIIRHILGSFGFVPPPNFGKTGITSEDFMLKNGFDLEFENEFGEVELKKFGLWCGYADYGGRIRVLGTDVCDPKVNYHEFCVAYKVDNSPIHILKHIFEHDGLVIYRAKIEKDGLESWRPVGVEQKLLACAGLERFNKIGIKWNPCNEFEDLLPALLEAVEMT